MDYVVWAAGRVNRSFKQKAVAVAFARSEAKRLKGHHIDLYKGEKIATYRSEDGRKVVVS